MRYPEGGFTIVETMIVLAVSAILFATTVVLFQGRQGKEAFAQSMRDLDSKVQDWINDVPTGFYPTGGQKCQINGGTQAPQLNGASNVEQGTNSDCVFLGKAIQFVPDPGDQDAAAAIHAYSVLGSRSDTTGTFATSHPTPLLREDYEIGYGSYVKSVSANGSNAGSMVGFYVNFGSSNNTSMNAKVYPLGLQSVTASGIPGPITNCISGGSPCSLTPNDLNGNGWTICLVSTTSKEEAKLVVYNSAAGATTTMELMGNGECTT